MVSRRRFLQSTAVATALVAGCIGGRGDRGATASTGPPSGNDGAPTQFQYDAANTGVVESDAPGTASERWRTRLEPAEGGVALSGETLAVAARSLVGLDVTDGEEQWRVDVGQSLGAPPTATQDTVFVPTWNGTPGEDRGVVAVDPSDGSVRWRAVPDVDVNTPLTLADGVVFGGGGLDSEEVVAIDADDGDVRWRFPAGEYATTAAVADGVAYVGGGKSRAAFAIDAENGDELWRFDAGERIWGAPTVWDDTVYVAGRGGGVWALDPANGDERWRRDLGGPVHHTLAASEDGVVVPTEDQLVSFAHDGTERWTAPLQYGGRSPTITADGLVCTDRHRLYCFDGDGTERWRHDVPDRAIVDAIYGGVRSPPIVADGTVYLVSHAGDVYAIGEE